MKWYEKVLNFIAGLAIGWLIGHYLLSPIVIALLHEFLK